jgi:hypothetical protein
MTDPMYINKAPLSEGEVKTILSNVEKGLTVQFDPALPLDQYESIVDQLTKGAIIYKLTKGGSND